MATKPFFNSPSRKWQEEFSELMLEEKVDNSKIVLYNDDVHTFDFVIDALIDVCEHSVVQAEQCTWLVHYKGKCAVKSGNFDELKPKCERLLNKGLTAEIE